MKIASIIVVTLLLVGCTSTRPNTSLTAEQVKAVAIKLANDKAFQLYHCQPFDVKAIRQPGCCVASFWQGHWVCMTQQRLSIDADIRATIELAADGSTNNVNLQIFKDRIVHF